MPTHSRLAPSSAHIWAKPDGCTGFVQMVQGLPNISNEYALEGSAAHELADKMFNDYKKIDVLDDQFKSNYIGHKTSNGFIVDVEMFEHIRAYVAYCLSEIEHSNDYAFETKVYQPTIHSEFFGTVDFYNWHFTNDNRKILKVTDLKYGFTNVEPEWNWQLLCYAPSVPKSAYADEVWLQIYQPRAYGNPILKIWKIDQQTLSNAFKQIQSAARIALSNDAKLLSGSHCKNCRARSFCPANRQASLKAIESSYHVGLEELRPDELANEIEILQRAHDLIGSRLTAMEEYAKTEIEKGKNIKGLTLDFVKGQRSWDVPDEDLIALGDLFEVDLKSQVKFVSPAQAEKKGVPTDIVNSYVKRTTTKKLKKTSETKAFKVLKKGSI